MKLHKDGTLEGTPQEIAEYNRLTSPQRQYASGIGSIGGAIEIIRQAESKMTPDIVEIQKEAQKNRRPWDRPMATL